MKLAIVGLGYWGPNLVRNFLSTPGVDSVVACDVSEKKLAKLHQKFPMVETETSFDGVLGRKDIEAVAIATPVSTHHPLGLAALRAGKHVLIEKPMAASTAEAEELVSEAARVGRVLMVDHTFIYTGAVRKIKELILSGTIGDLLYFDSVRINLGLFQHDTNVIWDLAPHDISIMDYLIGMPPESVSAQGSNHFNGMEDMAYITATFPDNLIAHFHVNWISPVKIRRIILGGSKHMALYDDMEPSEKLKVYDKGVDLAEEETIYKTLVQYRMGDMFAPNLDTTEALALMTKEFVESIVQKRAPLTDGASGLRNVRVLEAADQSLKQGGRTIILSPSA